MGRTVSTLAIAAAALTVALPAVAATGITVELDHTRRVVLSGTANDVVVGDPAIADVTLIDAHSIILMGKAYGATDVIVTDHAGHILLDGEVNVVAPAGTVTLHRGAHSADYSCSPTCEAAAASSSPGGAPSGNVSASN